MFCFGAYIFSSYIFLLAFVSYISILLVLQIFFLFRKQKSTRRCSSSARDAPISPAVRHVTPRLRQQFGSSSAAVRHVTPRLRQQFGSSSAAVRHVTPCPKCVTHDQKCVTPIRNALRMIRNALRMVDRHQMCVTHDQTVHDQTLRMIRSALRFKDILKNNLQIYFAKHTGKFCKTSKIEM